MIYIHLYPYDAKLSKGSYSKLPATADALTHKPYRRLLIQLLEQQFGIPQEEACFAKTERGKPYLSGHDVFFNVSHCEHYLAIAISENYDIGVDIEQPKSKPPHYSSIANRYFSPSEAQLLARQKKDDLQHDFFAMWTQKEALVKATGEGLSDNFGRYDTTQIIDNRMPKQIHTKGLWVQHWHLPAIAAPSHTEASASGDLYLSLAAVIENDAATESDTLTAHKTPTVSIITGQVSALMHTQVH